jgi:hypothetical protein
MRLAGITWALLLLRCCVRDLLAANPKKAKRIITTQLKAMVKEASMSFLYKVLFACRKSG